MNDVVKGTVAGAAATMVVSLVMLVLGVTGFEPQLEPTRLVLALLDASPSQYYALGWIVHIIIGSVALGGLFAYLEPRLGADTHTKSGVLFGVLAWIVVGLVILPAAGLGYFGFQLSLLAPLTMLGMQLLYGTVLGWTYGKLSHAPFTRHYPA